MKAKPLKLVDGIFHDCTPEEADYVRLNMPGPVPTRFIPVQIKGSRRDTENWSWNGDIDFPTLKPSILTKLPYYGKYRDIVCHSFVNDGMVQFLNDCSHELKGQTLPLLDIEEYDPE